MTSPERERRIDNTREVLTLGGRRVIRQAERIIRDEAYPDQPSVLSRLGHATLTGLAAASVYVIPTALWRDRFPDDPAQ